MALLAAPPARPLPLLGQVFDVPNLAVLFKEPKVLRPVRRWQKAFPSKVRMGPPIHKRKSRGFLVRIKDAPTLREVLEPWGVVGPITWDGLAPHAPPEEDRRRARRIAWRDNLVSSTRSCWDRQPSRCSSRSATSCNAQAGC